MEQRPSSPEMNFAKVNIYNFFNGVGGPVWGAFLAYYGPLMALLGFLGASPFYNGVVNGLFWLGFILTQVPAAYYSERLPYKKWAIGVIFILAGVSVLLFGILLMITGGEHVKLLLGAFLFCYALTTIISGSATPLIFALLFKIIPPKKLGSWLGVYFMIASVGGILGGFLVKRILQLGYPVAFEILFIGAFVFAAITAVAIWIIDEPKGELAPHKENFGVYMGSVVDILKCDRNLVRFFIGMWLVVGHYIVLTFYSEYAIKGVGISPAEAGAFVSMNLIGWLLASLGPVFFILIPLGWIMGLFGSKMKMPSNILSAGWIADKYGPKYTLIVFQIVAFIGVIIALFAHSVLMFYFVWIVAGFAQICNNIGYSNMGLLSCPIQDKSSYIGLVNFAVFPFVVIIPMVFGALIGKGILTIPGTFKISMALMVIATLFILFFVDNPEGFKKMKEQS
jgi:MFS family permease